MRYKTVKDVVAFVSTLKLEDMADTLLKIRVEFYGDGELVGELERNMYSSYTKTTLNSESVFYYIVEGFRIELREDCVAFVLSIKEPSSI